MDAELEEKRREVERETHDDDHIDHNQIIFLST